LATAHDAFEQPVTGNSPMVSKYPLGMPIQSLDGDDFRELFHAATAWLDQHHKAVNALNVFPVPDGDTGTNMLLTMQSALEEMASVQTRGASAVVQAAAHGALMGARGNSGVILSQILRGIAHGLSGEDLVDAAEMARAYRDGSSTAYRGVVRPVEGTILTVIREVGESFEEETLPRDLRDFFDASVRVAAESVERTPTLLKVLAEAGVVDAGGQGLLMILEGMHRCLMGLSLGAAVDESVLEIEHKEIFDEEYNYDVQAILIGETLDVAAIRDAILEMGDSVLVVGDARTIKVHVHTDEPGTPLNYLARMGNVDRVIVENMQLQYEQFIQDGGPSMDAEQRTAAPRMPSPAYLMPVPTITGPIGTVVVSSGDGLDKVFRSLGAGSIVKGGQTMNPSTQELMEAVEASDADDVILLPNNKNIILAAEQARDLADKSVRVVKSKSIPQGIAALLALNQQQDLDTNVQHMTAAISSVQSGEVTVAVRDVSLCGVEVKEGEFIGLLDDELVSCGDSPGAVVLELLDSMGAADHEIITMYRGEPLDRADGSAIEEELQALYVDQEIEILDGDQMHYHYIFSVE